MPDNAARDRAELFSKLPFETLRRARNTAAASGDLDLANDALRAMNLRASVQHAEIADCGQLFEHVQQPCRANGGRFITTYTGDPLAWMGRFMTGGTVCRINRETFAGAKADNNSRSHR